MDNSELNSTVESITGIQYDREKNYYKELRAQQLAKRFDEIKFEIQMLEKEENNIPFKDFRLKVIKEEQRLLTEYAISDFKLKYGSASMEKELASLYDKIQVLEEKYQKKMERFSHATKDSRKYSSYKKSNKLKNKVIELNAKIGLVESKQLMRAVNDFDSLDQQLKFNATTNVIDKDIRDMASSAKTKAKDTYTRVSKSKVVTRLKNMVGKLKGSPRVIESTSEQNESSIHLVA